MSIVASDAFLKQTLLRDRTREINLIDNSHSRLQIGAVPDCIANCMLYVEQSHAIGTPFAQRQQRPSMHSGQCSPKAPQRLPISLGLAPWLGIALLLGDWNGALFGAIYDSRQFLFLADPDPDITLDSMQAAPPEIPELHIDPDMPRPAAKGSGRGLIVPSKTSVVREVDLPGVRQRSRRPLPPLPLLHDHRDDHYRSGMAT